MNSPADRLQACLAFTLQYEGGYSDRENDPGNWYAQRLIGTNMGISAPALAAWVGADAARTLTAGAMKGLPLSEVRAIYAARYWNAVRGDDLPAGIDLMVFDFGVMAGPGTSARLVQRCLNEFRNCAVDGFVGPNTLALLRGIGPKELIVGIAAAQLVYLQGLKNFDQNPGWVTRNAARSRRALAMAEGV